MKKFVYIMAFMLEEGLSFEHIFIEAENEDSAYFKGSKENIDKWIKKFNGTKPLNDYVIELNNKDEKEVLLGETENFKFSLTNLDLKIEHKNNNNPFKTIGKYTNEFKGKLIDELKSCSPIVLRILIHYSSWSLFEAESGMQSEKFSYFEVFSAFSYNNEKFLETDDNFHFSKNIRNSSFRYINILSELNK